MAHFQQIMDFMILRTEVEMKISLTMIKCHAKPVFNTQPQLPVQTKFNVVELIGEQDDKDD